MPSSSITTRLVDKFGVWRDAFPSIHAAVSMLIIVYAWRYLRRFATLYTVLGVSILISTVYLRWHYVTDVLAGILLAAVAAWISPRVINADFLTEAVQQLPGDEAGEVVGRD